MVGYRERPKVDSAFYRRIGSLGGRTHHEKDPDYFRKIGRRGGEATARKLQDEDFREDWVQKTQDGRRNGERE